MPTDVLFDLGANVWPVVLSEPWRLLTSAFLHADVIHILFNSFALLAVGRVLEVQLGSARLWVIYVLAAVGGSVCSDAWQAVRGQPAVSIGASGGAFGLILLGYVYASRVPERLGSFAAGLRSWLVTIALFSLLFIRELDHAAHLGGAAVGALFGRQLDTRPGPDPHPAWVFLAHGLALLALASFAAVVMRLRAGA
ncbi:MAG: rhomboid family intramembrane serine protease [Planctomycetes bacterium]|nr:rhomboid family intramembrane serine protease [Planctomycetota bacterium]